ncbi:MAG TPA: hypothetical protein VIP77_05600 [Jiangellaceae bacterium]
MSDERGDVEPSTQLVDPFDVFAAEDPELAQRLRRLILKHDRERAARTTDDHGDPFPRLDLDDPPATPDDPLLNVGYALLAVLPDGWEAALLTAAAAADEVRTMVVVRMPGDATFRQRLLYLPTVAEACSALRRSVYDAAGRAWYGLILRLERSGVMHASYEFDEPPFLQWGPREVDLVRRDQELYPRDPAQLPGWHPAR